MRVKTNHIKRIGRRKYARLSYGFLRVLKGFLFGLVFGVVIALTASSARAQSTNTQCGGTSQPRCEVNLGVDSDMTATKENTEAVITQANNSYKSLLDDIDVDKFKWQFIPDIPTAECENLQIVNPAAGWLTITMDICTPFNKFKRFITGVLAVFCLIGCAHQIQSALKA